ncbi:antitoxin VbhA family protein [Nocardia harenae]|uniref:antitoxin VbhA family protein n=1 Tax=Nocardia harenae TaxID=358707 RepID=UPI000AD07179|nr:antitoxin VbhA family protein [Nocardia harenae]
MSDTPDVERRVKAVIAGNRMAGHETPPRTVKRMRDIAAGRITADEAVAATIAKHRKRRLKAS